MRYLLQKGSVIATPPSLGGVVPPVYNPHLTFYEIKTIFLYMGTRAICGYFVNTNPRRKQCVPQRVPNSCEVLFL